MGHAGTRTRAATVTRVATEPLLAGAGRGGGRPAAIALTLVAAITLAACGGRASNDPALASQAPRRRAEPAPAARETPSQPTTTETSGDESSAPRSSDAAPPSASGQWWDAYADRDAIDTFEGRVSYYSDALAGRSTASGAPYDPTARTAASRTLAFGTVLRVTRVDTGASVIVRVNDRGPFGDRRRVLDLSRSAAEALDMIRRGVVEVRVEVIERP